MITVFSVGHQPWAEMMVRQVRSVMPDDVVQLTDMNTDAIPGVQNVIRRIWRGKDMVFFRMEHLAALDAPHITMDADVLVAKPLTHIWGLPFDVALTYRSRPVTLTKDHEGKVKGADVTSDMPINTGVMFSRNRDFFRDCYDRMKRYSDEQKAWWGDQLSVAAAARSGTYSVHRLECDEYNWTPSTPTEYNGAHVVHFKGTRKGWMSKSPIYQPLAETA